MVKICSKNMGHKTNSFFPNGAPYENAKSDILFSSLFLEFKISLNTAQGNMTWLYVPTVSEIARLRTQCIYANCVDSTFGCLRKHSLRNSTLTQSTQFNTFSYRGITGGVQSSEDGALFFNPSSIVVLKERLYGRLWYLQSEMGIYRDNLSAIIFYRLSLSLKIV